MYLVVFRNRKCVEMDPAAYSADAARMEELARDQTGFISFKSYAADDGEVIALSQWQSESAARDWARNAEHLVVQSRGRADYYESYTLFTCDDPRVHHFQRKPDQ